MEKQTSIYGKKIFSFSRLKDPPRKVPFMLWFAMMFNTVGFATSFTFFAVVTLLLSYAHPVDIKHQFMLDNNAKITEGTITEKKFLSDNGSFDGDYRYNYRYKTPDGIFYTGKSQSNDNIATNSVITVEYLEKKPQISRMRGTRRSFLFPYFAMIFVLIAYLIKAVQGFMTAGALKNGELADAEVKGVEEEDDGDQKMYVFSLAFWNKSGETKTFVHKTAHKENLVSDPTNLVLYDPASSKNVWLINEFPIPVEIDMDGSWKPPGIKLTLKTIAHLLLFITPVVYGLVRFLQI